jgi:hypothetical protein
MQGAEKHVHVHRRSTPVAMALSPLEERRLENKVGLNAQLLNALGEQRLVGIDKIENVALARVVESMDGGGGD